MFRRLIGLALLPLLMASVAFGQKQRQVMVVHPDVVVKNRSGGKVPVGLAETLNVTIKKGKYLWVPRLNGWVPEEDTLDLKDAVQLFSSIVKEKPSAQAWHHRGKAWYALGSYEKAIKDLDRAISIARTKRLSDRKADNERMVGLQINRANSYRKLGKSDQAIQSYTAALDLEPRNVIALANRGLIMVETGKFDAAMLDLNAAIRIKPDYPEARNHRGVCYWRQGKVREAERDYKKAAALRPGYSEPYYNLAAVERSQQNYKESLVYLKKAVKLDQDYVAALNDLAWLLATCSEESLRDGELAVKHATRACQLTKLKNANTIDTLAAALAEKGDFKEAVRRIEQALRLSNEDSKPQMTIRKNLYLTKQSFTDRS